MFILSPVWVSFSQSIRMECSVLKKLESLNICVICFILLNPLCGCPSVRASGAGGGLETFARLLCEAFFEIMIHFNYRPSNLGS